MTLSPEWIVIVIALGFHYGNAALRIAPVAAAFVRENGTLNVAIVTTVGVWTASVAMSSAPAVVSWC